MERECKNCKHFSYGMTVEQMNKWDGSNWGRYADGVCSLLCSLQFPRGCVARKPPHPAHSRGGCFEFDPKEDHTQMMIEETAGVQEVLDDL